MPGMQAVTAYNGREYTHTPPTTSLLLERRGAHFVMHQARGVLSWELVALRR